MSGKQPMLGSIRHYIVVTIVLLIGLRIILWAITPFLPYLVGAALLVTVIGFMIYRTTKF